MVTFHKLKTKFSRIVKSIGAVFKLFQLYLKGISIIRPHNERN